MKMTPREAAWDEVLSHIAHCHEEVAATTAQWLLINAEAAERHHDKDAAAAYREVLDALNHHRVRRQMDRLSGRED
jgi:hypothetical protein